VPVVAPKHRQLAMATIRVTQIRSSIRTHKRQKQTMEALGLRRINHTVEHDDTPVIRGMIAKVQHLVTVEEGK